MAASLLEEKNNAIPIYDLNDGQIGVIVEGEFYGYIVQRFMDNFCVIGSNSPKGFKGDSFFKVRILEEGEKIVITDNQ